MKSCQVNKMVQSVLRRTFGTYNALVMEENLDDFYSHSYVGKMSKRLLLFYNDSDQAMCDYVVKKYFLYEWFDEDMEVGRTEKSKQVKLMNFQSDGNYLSTCTKGAGKGEIFECSLY